MRLRATLFVCLVLSTSGCATAPGVHQITPAIEVAAPFNAVWDGVIDTFGENNWPISNMERQSGFISTDWMSVDPSHMDCGGAGLNSQNQHSVRFNVVVREAGAGATNLTVNTTWQVWRWFGETPGDWVSCNSRGSIERMVHESVASKIR